MATSCFLCENGVSLVAACLPLPTSRVGGLNIYFFYNKDLLMFPFYKNMFPVT